VCVASVGGTDSYRPQKSKGNNYAIAIQLTFSKDRFSKTRNIFPEN
jgi:hypothetical protein